MDQDEIADALQQLWPQHYNHLLRHAYCIVQDWPEAEEAVNDTWYAAAEHLGRGRSVPDDWRAWLTTVVSRKALTMRKVSRRRLAWAPKAALHLGLDGRDRGEHPAIRAVDAGDVLRRFKDTVIAQLHKKDRMVVVMHFYGYSHAEIAAAVKVNVKSVPTKLNRALAKLHRIAPRPEAARPGPGRGAALDEGGRPHARRGS